jgi:hypothetical protein
VFAGFALKWSGNRPKNDVIGKSVLPTSVTLARQVVIVGLVVLFLFLTPQNNPGGSEFKPTSMLLPTSLLRLLS